MKVIVNKKDRVFKALRFVGMARLKEEMRFTYCNYLIEVTDHCMAATDGRQLHVVYGKPPCKTGLYEITKFTRSRIEMFLREPKEILSQTFPRWREIIPRDYSHYMILPYSNETPSFGSLIINLLSKRNILVKYEYVETLKGYDLNKWHIFFNGPEEPVYFLTSDNKYRYMALVMPVSLRKEKEVDVQRRIVSNIYVEPMLK